VFEAGPANDRTGIMNVAVIGTGGIGTTLAKAFARDGHRVVLGSRTAADESSPGELSHAPTVRSVGSAIAGSEIVVLAVPGRAVAALLAEHHGALAGKLVVDATNIIGGGPAHSRLALATAAPTARYARALNTLGVENLADPRFGDEVADMFFSTAETDRTVVESLIRAVGLRPVYLGPDQEDVVDGVLRLWFALAVGRQRGRHLAFRVLERTDGRGSPPQHSPR
jgi:8-hydroxy-5-deazaflavin:NADPH oxidoreductase